MAKINNVSCYKGESVTLAFTMTPVVDISTWTLRFTLKKLATDVASVLSKTGTVTVGPSGTFSVALAKADTNIPARDYQYDVQRIDAGSEAVLSIGTFSILQEVLNP